MAKFCEIQWRDMHEFCVSKGLKLLNPPVVDWRDACKTVDWTRLASVPFVLRGHVVSIPAIDLYKPIRTGEVVYGKRVYMQGSTRQLTLRIYTTIDPWEGEVREKGTDAIRVALFWREVETDGVGNETALPARLIGGDRKCLRVMGWRANLGSRLESWPELIGPECYKCGRPMVMREGKRGPFWGCSGWRKVGGCDGIINVGEENIPRCPECERPMKLRTGGRGEFWGCVSYPQCRGTRNVG